MRKRSRGSEEEAEGGHGGTAMVPAHGRHDGHHDWHGSGTCGAMIPAHGGMAMFNMMGTMVGNMMGSMMQSMMAPAGLPESLKTLVDSHGTA